jgi:hypothetical protein
LALGRNNLERLRQLRLKYNRASRQPVKLIMQ